MKALFFGLFLALTATVGSAGLVFADDARELVKLPPAAQDLSLIHI